MCGISGIWKPSGASPEKDRSGVEAMLSCLNHRGPDDEGVWTDPVNGLTLGQSRLSIIDLSSAGHQPMLSEDRQVAITFNGEIYNFLELRAELEALGAVFRSLSDTEVLLKGYEHWGTEVLDKLVGMFAFAIWDRRKQQLFLARDRAGEKPLYYAQVDREIIFASELRAFKTLPTLNLSLDQQALALYLRFQYVPAPYSIYREVRKLPPAHAMLVTEEKTQVWRYWDPAQFVLSPRLNLGLEDALEQLGPLLRQAVKGQMIADVPLGAFLSGGIDSSAVVSMMMELASGPVKTFTIGFEVPGFDEVEHAAAVAEHLGTDHTAEYLTEKETLDLIPQIPQMYGEPFADASALPTHLVACVARKHVTVSLSGDGGDEAFGGYTRYNTLKQLEPWANIPSPLGAALRPLVNKLPGRASRLSGYLGAPLSQVYGDLVGIFSDKDVFALTGLSPSWPEYERVWSMEPKLSLRRRAILADMLTYLPEAVLTKVDRAAMATSLETRAPLLDHRILEFGLRLPEALVKDKLILKQFAYRRMSQQLLDRPKQGFGVPLSRWFRSDLRNLLSEALSAERLKAIGIQNTGLVDKLLRDHLSGRANHQQRLWALLVLSLWFQAEP